MSDYHMTRMFVRFFKADPVRAGLCEIVLSQTPSRWDASASNSKKLSEEDGAMAVWGYFLIYCLRTAEDISRKYERNHQQESDTSVFQIRTEPDRQRTKLCLQFYMYKVVRWRVHRKNLDAEWRSGPCVISSGTDLEMPETAEKQTAKLAV